MINLHIPENILVFPRPSSSCICVPTVSEAVQLIFAVFAGLYDANYESLFVFSFYNFSSYPEVFFRVNKYCPKLRESVLQVFTGHMISFIYCAEVNQDLELTVGRGRGEGVFLALQAFPEFLL